MEIYNSLEIGIKSTFGNSVSIVNKHYVGGGDINDARCLELSNGELIFVKMNSAKNAAFFEAEEAGLNAIKGTGAIGTPKLLFRGVDNSGSSSTSSSSFTSSSGKAFLAMEYISGVNRIDDFWETFGHELAAMHLARTDHFISKVSEADSAKESKSKENPPKNNSSRVFGFHSDNFIGASPQINTPRKTWIEFFRECRLEPQFKMAEHYFGGRGGNSPSRNFGTGLHNLRAVYSGNSIIRDIIKLLDKLSELLTEPAQPSLLHGDLWSGNYIVGNDGKAWLIDPATYIGHFEADLAMTELFGRFPNRFYESYSEVNKIDPAYKDKRDLYNLYHLTNHLNLFGETYLTAVISTIRHYI